MNPENLMRRVIEDALQDIRVELTEEFDRNFEQKAFFSRAWKRRRGEYRSDKPLLVDTGRLRRSISSKIEGNGISFTSTEPYAAIHNEGGVIVVTPKMKAYFWYKYREAVGAFGRKKDGAFKEDRRNAELSTKAQFYRAMALMKVGRKIHIPERRFIGRSREVEILIVGVVESHLRRYIDSPVWKLEIE